MLSCSLYGRLSILYVQLCMYAHINMPPLFAVTSLHGKLILSFSPYTKMCISCGELLCPRRYLIIHHDFLVKITYVHVYFIIYMNLNEYIV